MDIKYINYRFSGLSNGPYHLSHFLKIPDWLTIMVIAYTVLINCEI